MGEELFTLRENRGIGTGEWGYGVWGGGRRERPETLGVLGLWFRQTEKKK
jgi:hypothetical protein